MLQSIPVYFKKERPEWPRLDWRLFSLRWPHSPAYHTKSRALQTPYLRSASSLPVKSVYTTPQIEGGHTLCLSCLLAKYWLLHFILCFIPQKQLRLFHRLWDSPEQNPSLNMNSSSCPFFQMRVHTSGSSGQHFAWYCLTWGNCLLCRPSPTHEVCVSPWQSWREPCRSLFCITRRHWVCSEKWRGGKSHFNYAMFGII